MAVSRLSKAMGILVLALMVPLLLSSSLAEDCGSQAGGALCDGGYCCSQWGYCNFGDAYCGEGCQSGPCYNSPPSPPPPPPLPPSPPGSCGDGLEGIVSEARFNTIFPRHIPFYSYTSFIDAAKSWTGFGTAGDCDTRKREVAAFFANIHHETGGLTEINENTPYPDHYCDPTNFPCASGKQYYGRGPMQLSWNYNYFQCAKAIGVDIWSDPDLVATDSFISFTTAFWFWHTPQAPKPSCHDVMTGGWTPSSNDIAAGRNPGFGMTINIINGGLECGPWAPHPELAQIRVNLFTSICGTLGVNMGENLSCSGMQPYGFLLKSSV